MSKKEDIKNRISVHHIGGMAGSRVFPILDKFEKDIIDVIYDADSDCLDQVKEDNESLGSKLHLLPYCVGGTEFLMLNI